MYDQDYDLEVGKLHLLKSCPHANIAVIGCGAILSECLEASDKLSEQGVGIDVFDCHTIKPFDAEGVGRIFSKYSLVVSVEEHFLNGGLFSIISQVKASNDFSGRLRGIGVDDSWVSPGERPYVLEQLGLNADSIVAKIKSFTNEKGV